MKWKELVVQYLGITAMALCLFTTMARNPIMLQEDFVG
jgi:hypothetical protein